MLMVNLNLQPGERLAFVTDVPSAADWENLPADKLEAMLHRARMTRAIFQMMREAFGGNRIDLIAFPQTGQSGREPDETTARRFLEYNMLVMMTTHSLSHTRAREEACRRGARVASMPEVEAEMFAVGGPMAADYNQITRETNRWADVLTATDLVRLTTPQGTELRFSMRGRAGRADTGLLHERGAFGNLPGGEAYIAPVEGSAEGVLVVPAGWYPALTEAMRLTFQGGLVTAVEGGGAVGDHFRQVFAFDDPQMAHRRTIAELGIGANPNAKNPGNVLEAEKIKGTVHVAVGDSSHIGGVTESDLHEDFVLPNPTLWLDEERVDL